MKASTALRKITVIELELFALSGPRDSSTAEGRRKHNRRSTLYRRRKRMLKIIEREYERIS